MQRNCGADTSSTVDINRILETRGETRCLRGVGVYWLFIQTYHDLPWHRERHSEIMDLLQLLNRCTKSLKSHKFVNKIFPRLRGLLSSYI